MGLSNGVQIRYNYQDPIQIGTNKHNTIGRILWFPDSIHHLAHDSEGECECIGARASPLYIRPRSYSCNSLVSICLLVVSAEALRRAI